MQQEIRKEVGPREYLYQPDSSPLGKSYVKWAEDWWNWLAGIPKNANPAKDGSGRHGRQNQPGQDVWFLAGEVEGKAKRKIEIPAGRAILCPVVNFEWSLYEMLGFARRDIKTVLAAPQITNEELDELKDFTKDFLDDMYSLDVIIDEGEEEELKLYTGELCKYRISSEFDLKFTENNIFNTLAGTTKACADGYWIFIKEDVFEKGTTHTLWFRGVTQYYQNEVTYSISII